jgi:hypothetical protein
MPIMIAIPDACKSLAEAVQGLIASVERGVQRQRRGPGRGLCPGGARDRDSDRGH